MENGYKLWVQCCLGSFGWTSVSFYNWPMVFNWRQPLTTHKWRLFGPKRSQKSLRLTAHSFCMYPANGRRSPRSSPPRRRFSGDERGETSAVRRLFCMEWGIYPKSTSLAYRACFMKIYLPCRLSFYHPTYIFGLISLPSHVVFFFFLVFR